MKFSRKITEKAKEPLRKIARGIRRRLARFFLGETVYCGDHIVFTKTIYGLNIFLDTKDLSVTPGILMNHAHEEWIVKVFLAGIRAGMTVIDIGANVGYYSLLAAYRVGKEGNVISFEPDLRSFKILHMNIDINGCLDRVELVKKGVFDGEGIREFFILKNHHGSSCFWDIENELKQKYMETTEAVEVDTVSLDEFFKGRNMKVDVIKIDAEGSEPWIFDGMRNIIKNNPRLLIITEFFPTMIRRGGRDPEAFLKSRVEDGFKLKIIDRNSRIKEKTMEELLAVTDWVTLFLKK